jgi:outer membrane protein OmpA-like peptidoglycan-associated protein
MKVKLFCSVVLLGLVLAVTVNTWAAADKQAVNRFYAQIKDAVNSGECSLPQIVSLVAKNRPAAEKCLEEIKRKAETASEGKEAFVLIRNKLDEGLLLTVKGPDCSPATVGRLMDKAGAAEDADDKALFLEKVVEICPRTVDVYKTLADLYLKERRFALAVATYRKGLGMKKDPKAEHALKQAQAMLDEYKKGRPITVASVTNLFESGLMSVTPELQIRNALQTNRILFEPWSSVIKKDYSEELDVVGKAVKDQLSSKTNVGLLIEGHADQRGAPEKNLEISKQRAEAIKNYLVKNYGIEPDRIQTKGYGYFKPFAPNDTEEDRRLNRRVEFKKTDK